MYKTKNRKVYSISKKLILQKNLIEKPFETQSIWYNHENFKWKLLAKSIRNPLDKQYYLKYSLFCELDYNSNKMSKYIFIGLNKLKLLCLI